ncbi:hypothetical protein [Pontibacter chitinilyticus]|uniref:hypothetical protein n=1 Tax=Pontibacter chitinilyticus TaxID=2674989 RepID=UPI00321A9457
MNFNILKCFFLMGFVVLNVQISWAQTYLEEVGGRPIRIGQYVDVHGSPYLQDDWAKGTVQFANGKAYDGLDLKYDMVADMLLFKDDKGQTLEFVQPVAKFTVETADGVKTFQNGFPGEGTATDKSYYQVLANGKATLLKRGAKVVREAKQYNSATIEKNIMDIGAYYINKDVALHKIKNNEKAVLAELSDQAPALKEFIKANKLNLKEEEDLVKLVNYYNSL